MMRPSSLRSMGCIALSIMSISLSASAGELLWAPQWTQGQYWIVRSAIMAPMVDQHGNQIGVQNIGDYFTRFKVESLVHSAGGRSATLEIRWNANNEHAYEDNPEYVKMEIDVLSLSVLRVTRFGLKAGGEAFEIPWSPRPDDMGKRPFCWRWDKDVLPGATASLPLAEPSTSSPGAFVIKSISQTTGWPFEQLVEVQGDVATVVIQADRCAAERLRLRADSKWYDVIDRDGAVLQEVIEVGQK